MSEDQIPTEIYLVELFALLVSTVEVSFIAFLGSMFSRNY